MLASFCSAGRRLISDRAAIPTTGTTMNHGTIPIRFVPEGMGGTEPTSVRMAPDGPRPMATMVVPGASVPVAGNVVLMVPIWSTRTATGSSSPNWTVTSDRPRNPMPSTLRLDCWGDSASRLGSVTGPCDTPPFCSVGTAGGPAAIALFFGLSHVTASSSASPP